MIITALFDIPIECICYKLTDDITLFFQPMKVMASKWEELLAAVVLVCSSKAAVSVVYK